MLKTVPAPTGLHRNTPTNHTYPKHRHECLSTIVYALLAMPPVPGLTEAFEAVTRNATHNVSSPGSHALAQDDFEARTTIIFGTFGTLIAAVGIVLAGATLRLMYRSRLAESHNRSDVVMEDGLELHVVEVRVAPQERIAGQNQ